MSIPSLLEIQKTLSQNRAGSSAPFRILVLQNFTFNSIESHVRYHLLHDQLEVEFIYGGFDTIYQDSCDLSNITNDGFDLILIASYFPMVSRVISECYTSLSKDAIYQEVTRINTLNRDIIKNIRKQSHKPIVLFNVPRPIFRKLGIYDSAIPMGEIGTYTEINIPLNDLAQTYQSLFVLDLDYCVGYIGSQHAYMHKYWVRYKMPFSYELQHHIGCELAKYIRALSGKTKKCLVLDCDNVLWGGILGEVGCHNIHLGESALGLPYLEFQRSILELYHRGVLLAICSKNNESDVIECLGKNQNMLLHKAHFVNIKANWDNKADNIYSIAKELNIGLNSLVFMDDSSFEIDMIRSQLPEVAAIQADIENPLNNVTMLLGSGLFDSIQYTDEDKIRTELYHNEKNRNEHKRLTNNLEDYLRSLDMMISISYLKEDVMDRALQLLQRTNQFNVTANRYNKEELIQFSQSDDYDVLILTLTDRFGAYGNCGLAILDYTQADVATIQSFLLSCRVLGRGVEDVFIRECARLATTHGCHHFRIHYRDNKKNSQCVDFLKNIDFKMLDQDCFEISLELLAQYDLGIIDVNKLSLLNKEERC